METHVGFKVIFSHCMNMRRPLSNHGHGLQMKSSRVASSLSQNCSKATFSILSSAIVSLVNCPVSRPCNSNNLFKSYMIRITDLRSAQWNPKINNLRLRQPIFISWRKKATNSIYADGGGIFYNSSIFRCLKAIQRR